MRYKTRYVMGVHCIQELLKYAPDRILKIYTTKKGSERPFLKGVSFQIKGKDELTKLVSSDSHQSLIAKVKEKEVIHLKDFLQKLRQKEKSSLVLLDHIYDPQNLGAILRACECFQVDGVIWSKNRGVDITPIVAKASAGASEFVSCIRVSNLAESISLIQKEGFLTLAADVHEKAKNVLTYPFPLKTAIVMGSEGKGIQPLVLKRSDELVYIPMLGKIDSLNVSQATAVILSKLAD